MSRRPHHAVQPKEAAQDKLPRFERLKLLLGNREEAVQQALLLGGSVFSGVEVFSDEDLNLVSAREWLRSALKLRTVAPEAKAVGAVLGLVVGDALGAPLEFQPLTYPSERKQPLIFHPQLFKTQDYYWKSPNLRQDGFNRFGLEPGQWTDDAAMALCLADSLINSLQKGVAFDALDLRMRFVLWWHCGYNNAFFGRPSVGLGGNISESMQEFLRHPNRTETLSGTTKTSGNGSLMRLAPCAVALWNNKDQAMRIAAKQSLTTHQGTEAKELCALLAHIIVAAITGGVQPGQSETVPDPAVVAVLGDLDQQAGRYLRERTVRSLARGTDGGDWNWKTTREYRYNCLRAQQQPGYAGSYSMDGMAMALHCVWTTSSFQAAVLKAANHCGDADTVAAITGQIAGAIYGVSSLSCSIPAGWMDAVEAWSGQGRITAKALYLFRHGPGLPVANSNSDSDTGGNLKATRARGSESESTTGAMVSVGCCGLSRRSRQDASGTVGSRTTPVDSESGSGSELGPTRDRSSAGSGHHHHGHHHHRHHGQPQPEAGASSLTTSLSRGTVPDRRRHGDHDHDRERTHDRHGAKSDSELPARTVDPRLGRPDGGAAAPLGTGPAQTRPGRPEAVVARAGGGLDSSSWDDSNTRGHWQSHWAPDHGSPGQWFYTS